LVEYIAVDLVDRHALFKKRLSYFASVRTMKYFSQIRTEVYGRLNSSRSFNNRLMFGVAVTPILN
jgi:hypothetical protein